MIYKPNRKGKCNNNPLTIFLLDIYMLNDLELILILGTGRNGSYQMHKIFEKSNLLNSYHEHNFTRILEIGISKQLRASSSNLVKERLAQEYINKLNSLKGNKHIDFSNALPWVSKELISMTKKTTPIFLARSGIKVVSSFFNKFKEIMYPENLFEKTIQWKESNFEESLKPPLDKVYWRPLVPEMLDLENLEAGRRFKMICYYWKICCEKSMNIIKENNNSYIFKFEELISNKQKRSEFCEIVGEDKDFLEKKLDKPMNVAEPVTYHFNDKQKKVFNSICSKTMRDLNYEYRDYEIKY